MGAQEDYVFELAKIYQGKIDALRAENARLAGRVEELEEALETARCALESPTFPSLKGSETVKAVRAALRAPTAPREAAKACWCDVCGTHHYGEQCPTPTESPSTVKPPTNSGTNSAAKCIAPSNGDACFDTQSDGCPVHKCDWPHCECPFEGTTPTSEESE